jgi:RHS repeat-associated protein
LLFLLIFNILFNFNAKGQTVPYGALYSNATFNKTINLNLPVGTIGASANVSNGTANYTIPIILPQGTNGVVPAISINYNSQGQNGPLAYGWSLAASSLISRVPRNIYHDGAVNPVEIYDNDRFTLDGERLILKTGTTYGKESEDFSTTTSYGYSFRGPLYFITETKEGVKYEFGNTVDSRFMDTNNQDVLYWRLNKISYRDGNYVEYKYTTQNSEMLLDEIKYTGNSITGLLPYNKIKFNYLPRLDVNTTYEAGTPLKSNKLLDNIVITTDNNLSFKTYLLRYGLGTDNVTSMLKLIEERGSDGIELNSTIFKYGEIPKDFEFNVSEINTGGFLLEEANTDLFNGDYDGDGYTDLLKVYYIKTTLATGVELKTHTGFKIYNKTYPIDPSFAIFSLAYSETFPVGSSFQLVAIGPNQKRIVPNVYNSSDYNGDGKDDILFHKISIIGTTPTSATTIVDYFKLYTSTSSTGSNTFTFAISQIAPPTSNAPNCAGSLFNRFQTYQGDGQFFYPGDYNGDGISDYITVTSNGSAYKAMIHFPSLGSFNNEIVNANVINNGGCYTAQGIWALSFHNVIDFDGDGKTDIMITRDLQTQIFSISQNNSTGLWEAKLLYEAAYPTKYDMMFFGDFNGDRKTDILLRTNINDVNAPWKKVINTGKGFIVSDFSFYQTPQIIGNNTKSEGDDKLFIADINGDGKSDIFHGWNYYPFIRNDNNGNPVYGAAKNSNHDVYYSSGDVFKINRTIFGIIFGKESQSITDLNGDGRADFINRTSVGNFFFNYYFKKEGKELLLEKVKNGIDHDIEFSYKRMTEAANFYTKGTTTVYPINDIQAPIYLVSQFKSENGIGGFNQIDYKYEEARIHKQGKGLLGFKKMTSIDGAFGLTTISESALNYTFYVSIPTITSKYLTSTNALLNQTTNTFSVINQGGKRFWLRLDMTNENKVFEGQTSVSNMTYDSYGNVKFATTNNNGIVSKIINSSYGQFGTPIPSKLTLMTETVTRTGQPAYSTTSTYAYNTIGQLKSKEDFSGLPKAINTTYGYDLFGNQNATTVTPTGMTSRSTSTMYDTKGRFPISSKNVLNQTSTVLMDTRWGQPITTIGIDGLTTTFTYDNLGRVLTTTLPQGYTITNTYGWEINATEGTIHYAKTTHPGKPDEKKWFDLLDRVRKKETENYGNTTSIQKTTYDARGNVATSTLPYKVGETILTTTNTFDEYNRPKSASNTIGTTSYNYAYVSGTLKTTIINPALQEKSSIADASGKMISATDYGGTLNYTYYSHGKIKDVKNGTTTLTSNEYDAYARQTKLTDINAGITQYDTDALGQVTSTISATNQTTSFAYDIMGRKISQLRPEGNTTYQYYDTGNGASTNQLQSIYNYGNINKYFFYDNFGRLKAKFDNIDGDFYTNYYSYNIYDDILTQTYPSGIQVNYSYDANGFLNTIKNNTTTLYTQNSTNGLGQNTSYTLGNGKTSTTGYYFGTAYNYSTPSVQNLTLGWNYQSGNLNSRYDALKGTTENFTYDNLNRLTSATVVGLATMNFNFAPNGNIANKTDVGVYVYGGPKINAVTEVTNTPGVINTNIQNIVYTSFYQPLTISENNNLLSFTYDDEDQRIKTVSKLNNVLVNIRYFMGDYEKNISNGVTKHLHYISSGDKLIAIIETNGSNITYHYIYTDHLGSLVTSTNSSGAFDWEQNFDAWGRSRNATNWNYANIPTNPDWQYRGYTGHEHLSQFALINMNGRLYDPILGRMLSPDNNIQLPDYTQNYNRYSYAMNNPLKFTDPDGEFLFIPILIGAAIGAATSAAVYTVTTLITGGKWSWSGLGTAAAYGAVGGALGAGVSQLATGLGAFGHSLGFNILNNIATNTATNIAFGNQITLGSIIGGAAAGVVGAKYGNFKGVEGGVIENIASEILFNSTKGAVTGAIGGGITSAINGENVFDGAINGAKIGAIGGATQAGLNNLLYGAAYVPKQKYGHFGNNVPVYRRGWFKGIGAITLGRNLILNENVNDVEYEAHETRHYYQQIKMGFGLFYQRIVFEYMHYGFNCSYETPGTLEFNAEWYGKNYGK